MLLLLLEASPGSAQQARRRVVLITTDSALAHATRTALAAWQLDLMVVADSTLSTVDANGDRLRQIARRYAASAVVWSRGTAHGSELVVYDGDADRLLGTRETAAPPFDAATAAAIALSVKTLLRHATGMPEAASEDATSNAAGAAAGAGPVRSEPAATPGRASAQASAAPAAVSRSVAAEAPPPEPATAAPEVEHPTEPDGTQTPSTAEGPRAPWELTLTAAGGFRSAVHDVAPEVRFGIGVELWPAASAFGIGLDASAGSGFRVPGSEVDARLIEPALRLTALLRSSASSSWIASASLGPALHFGLLRGELTADGSRIDVTRVTPQVQAGLRLEWRALDQLNIGIWGQAGVPLLRQRYWVGQELVLESRSVTLAAGIAVGVPFRW